MIQELREFSKFVGTRLPMFSEEGIVHDRLFKMINEHLVLIATDDERGPMGFIAGYVTPHIMNPGITTLCEVLYWVSEKHRRTRAGLLLMDGFVKWGRENCDWICFGLESNSPVNDATLLKRGFRLKERNFLLEVGD